MAQKTKKTKRVKDSNEFPSFHSYALRKNLDELTFPYASAGLKIYKHLSRAFTWFVVIFIIGFVLWAISAALPLIPAYQGEGVLAKILTFISTYTGLASVWVKRVSYIFLTISFLWWVAYAVVAILRWRSFERNVLRSDRRAKKLRKSLLKEKNISRLISDQQNANQKERENSDRNKTSLENEIKLEALKAVSKLKVSVNERQSLDSEDVMRYYAISIDMPNSQKKRDAIISLIDDVGQTANRIDYSELRFGDYLEFEDGSKVVFQDAYKIKDKYAKAEAALKQDDRKSEFSIDLSLFNDEQAEIDAKKLSANRWAKVQADVLDNFFKTKGLTSRQLNVVVGASTALIEYELSLDLKNLNSLDSYSKVIDSVFDITGTTITISGKKMSVTLPLPVENKLPIDVPTMYRQTFGSEI